MKGRQLNTQQFPNFFFSAQSQWLIIHTNQKLTIHTVNEQEKENLTSLHSTILNRINGSKAVCDATNVLITSVSHTSSQNAHKKRTSVDVYFQLIHSNIFIADPLVKAQTDFNVIPHFLAQWGSELWTTTSTAGAICCTPLWVPQRVVKVPLGTLPWSSIPRLTEVVFSDRRSCSMARIRGRTGASCTMVIVFRQSYRKGQMWFWGLPWVSIKPSTSGYPCNALVVENPSGEAYWYPRARPQTLE